MKAAYLGPEKTFTERAARKMLPDATLIPVQPIRNVVMEIEKEKYEFGVVPIENFYNGEVRETLDSLIECSKTKIIREDYLQIVHCLGALPNHINIKKILSKDQALEQCSKYLCANYPNAAQIATQSTAEAVDIIIKQNMLDAAVISSEDSLKANGLEILAKDICPNNRTRFVLLGRNVTKPTNDDKTFLAIHPPVDKPGILADVSNAFALYRINLEYFQSRPDGKKGYIFYAELDGHQEEERVIRAIATVKYALDPENKFQDVIKILGSYPNSHWKDEN